MSLTADGFSRKTLPEIKTELDASFTDALGPVNTNADSVLGQIIGIFAEAISDAEAVLQDNYDSMYPYSAEGTSLDGAVSYVGISRLEATATQVTCAAYGAEGQLVPANSLATVADINYYSTSDVVISRSNSLDVNIEVATLSNSASYQVLAGGESITYVSDSTATKAEIVAGLAALFDPDTFTATADDEVLRVYAEDGVSPFALTVDAKLTITKLGSPVVFVADTTGANSVPAGAMTATSDGVELYNLIAGSTGRDVESDADLRIRHAQSVRGTGAATVEAIKARLLADVDGVSSVAIYENRTSLPVDGQPAHSFETIVQGGSNSDVAAALWLYKPAGIETYGNVTVLTPDTAGDNQEVSFSRPVTTYGWLTIAVTALNTEEVLPSTAAAGIKDAALAYADAEFGVGDDIILQKFIGAIYAAVPGLGGITITADATTLPTDTPTYSGANITVARAEVVEFATSRMTVTGL